MLNNGKSISYYFKYIVSEVLGKALPFLLLPLLTRLFTPEEYGQLTEFSVFYNVCFTIGAFSSFNYLRKLYFDKVDVGQRYLSTLVLSLIVIILCVIFLKFLQYFNPQILKTIDYEVSFLIVISVFSLIAFKVMMSVLNFHFKASSYLKYNTLFALVNIVLTFLFLFYIETHINGRILGILTAPVVFLPVAYYIFNSYHRISKTIKLNHLKEQLLFSTPLLPHSITAWLRISFDRILISSNLGLAILGEYSANAQVAMVFFVIFVALNQALAPKILQKYKEDNASYMKYARLFILLYLLVYILLVPILYFITPFLFGDDFQINFSVIFCLSIAFLFNGWYSIFTHYLIQNKLGGSLSMISAISAVLHIGIIYFFMPYYGIGAVLIASLLSYFTAFILVFLKVRSEIKRENTW